MANCPTEYYSGRAVPLEIVLDDCGDTKPLTGDYIPVGAVNTRSFTMGAEEADTTSDATFNGPMGSIQTYQTMEYAGDGKARNGDGTISNHAAILKYFNDELAAGRSATCWVRLTFPDVTVEAFCLLTDPCSRSGSDADSVTFSFAAKAVSRPVQEQSVFVTDTP